MIVGTRGYDTARTGVNSQETVLTASAVARRGIRRVASLQLPGDARGAEAQPLILPSVTLADGQVRDLQITATMANQIACFDATDGTLLWSGTVGRPVLGTPQIDAWKINMRQPGDAFDGHWGILSTPAIHPAHPRMYACAWSSPDGLLPDARHWLVEVSLRSGQVTRRLDLDGAAYDPGHGLPIQKFASAARKQRASLTFATGPSFGAAGTVFIPFGSVWESARSNRGWIIAVDIAKWAVTAAWCTAVRGSGGGIWQAGSGLAMDAAGFLYAMTGNGDFDARTEWGECFVKLRYTPPSAAISVGRIDVVDWWSPFLDSERTSAASGTASDDDEAVVGLPVPTNMRRYALTVPQLGIDAAAGPHLPIDPGEARDMDLGSGGPVVLDDLGLVLGAGKDGVLYVLHKDRMGKTQPGDLKTQAGIAANYAKLASPPIWFTFYTPDANPAPANIRELNYLFYGKTHHQHGSPIAWKRPDGWRVFNWGENGQLRAWSVEPGGAVKYLASGAETASINAPATPGGMPGGFMCLSWDGKDPATAALWATIPYGDANRTVTDGRLLGYAADPIGDGRIRKIWDSQDWGIRFKYNKFCSPVVSSGSLIVPTFEAANMVFVLA